MRDDPTVIDLVLRARAGDQCAWEELVERFAPLLWSICRRYQLSGPDADDVGQGVWLRLLEHLPAIREPAALPGWLATTTMRECLRVVRISSEHDRREIPVDDDQPMPGAPASAEETLLVEERNAAVRAAFAQLPPQCRRLLSMLVNEPPLSYAEISDQLKVPVGGLGPTRARCLKKLRRYEPLASLIEESPIIVRGGDERERRMVEW